MLLDQYFYIQDRKHIEDMFDDESKDQFEIPKDEVSLNFTVTSRSSKNHKKNSQDFFRHSSSNESTDILQFASNQLEKFTQWLKQNSEKSEKNIESINNVLTSAQIQYYPILEEEDFELIRTQILRKDNDSQKQKECKVCEKTQRQLKQLQELTQNQNEVIRLKQVQIDSLNEQIERMKLDDLKEYILSNVDTIFLNEQIKELNNQILNLKNQKSNLEKTYLFNKTKNSQLQMKMELQKSKGLSAAKNSTHSSEIIARNNQSIIFIDPIQSDVQEWIKFFQNQKVKYKAICKRQEIEREKQYERKLTKAQKTKMLNQVKAFTLFGSIKNIIENLQIIRSQTANFLPTQDTNKSPMKQKFMNQNQQIIPNIDQIFKIENQNLSKKIQKLIKINQSLIREKKNYEQINSQLKDERFKQNAIRNNLQLTYRQRQRQIELLEEKVFFLETQISSLGDSLIIKKQENILMTRTKNQLEQKLKENFDEFQNMKIKIESFQSNKEIKLLQNKLKFAQRNNRELDAKNKQLQISLKSLELRLKKQKNERKKLHNQLEDFKGSIRVYCRIRPRIKNEIHSQVVIKALQDRILIDQGKTIRFDKAFGETMTQQKIFEDVKRLIQSAFDGFNLCIFAYGQTGSGKTYTIHGTQQNPGIAPRLIRQLFKLIENEKQIVNIDVHINMVEIYNDKIIDLFKIDKNSRPVDIKEDEKGNIYLVNSPVIHVENIQNMEDLYSRAISNRKTRQTEKNEQSSRSHFIFSILLEFTNKKTQEKYSSKINLIDLAGAQKFISHDTSLNKQTAAINKSLTALSNVILAITNKQNHIPYRDNKLTYLLKDQLNSNGKMLMFVNISPTDINKDESISSLNFGQRLKAIEKVVKRERPECQKEQIVKVRKSISRLSNN